MLNNIKIIALVTLLSSSTLIANDKFVGASLGYSNLHTKQDNDNVTLVKSDKQDGYNIDLEMGYNYTEKTDFIISYQKIVHDDTYIDNFILSFNYKLSKIQNFTPYVGASAGYSRLHWDAKPINTLNNTDNDYVSGSSLWGIIMGATKPINKNLDLNINYKYQHTNHKTYLESQFETSTLTHNNYYGLNIGVRWKF